MNDNVKLLNFIYQNSQMGVETIEQLEKIVEDKDFKRYLKEKIEKTVINISVFYQ